MHSNVTSADGTSIAYEVSGDGPPLIVIGGAFNDRGSAAPLARVLAPHFTVVRYDRRGRGDSGDTQPYAVAREIEDLAALAGAVGGEAWMYGHSSGGALALRAAAELAVTRLAVYDVPYTPEDEDARKATRQNAVKLRALVEEDRRADAVIHFVTGIGLPPEMIEGMPHSPMFPALKAIAHTLVYDSEIMNGLAGSPVPEDLVRSVTIPTLVTYGAMGPGLMKVTAERLMDLLPDGRQVVLKDQDHDVAPGVLAPILVEFFQG